MFDPSAQRLMEQQFGSAPGYDDGGSGNFQNNGGGVTTRTTKHTTTRTHHGGSSRAPNGSTVIQVGDDDVGGGGYDVRHSKRQSDLNHNMPMQQQGYSSTHVSSSSSSRGGYPDSNHLQVPGGSAKKSSRTSQSPNRRGHSAGQKARSSKGSRMQSDMSQMQSNSPQVNMHVSQMSPQQAQMKQQQMQQQQMQQQQRQMRQQQAQMQQEQVQMHQQQGQMHPQRGQMYQQQGQVHQQQGQMHSGSLQTNTQGAMQGLTVQPPEMSMQSSGNQMNPSRAQTGVPHRLNQRTEEMLHSPGGQSDVSWASLPSAYKGPFPPGKAPIDIQVHSPTLSDASFDSNGAPHTVRDVQTEMPRAAETDAAPKGKKFLKKVQKELEEQRGRWKDDVDKLTGGMIGLEVEKSPNGEAYGSSSFIDTSSGHPIFKAAVDLSGYKPEDITVTVDKLVNKAVVQAVKKDRTGFPTKTFTQRIQLPRFADDPRLVSKLGKNGQLKLEVPLIYYFDDMRQEGRKAKSFVYQVNKGKDGKERLEILVNTGSGFRARDLKVQVHDDHRLVIIGEKEGGPKKLIKQYTLPAFAHTDGITSRLGKDGRLQVYVPIKRGNPGQ